MHPPPPLSRDQLRELDRRAADDLGLPTIVLMENAARGLAEVVASTARELALKRITLVCGPGNNGGDGFAAARQLVCLGLQVRLACAFDGDARTPDARTNRGVCTALGIPEIRPAGSDNTARTLDDTDANETLVVDALLGTGIESGVRADAKQVIDAMNRFADRGGCVVACDLPSGLDANKGEPLGVCVRARLTVTFAAPKIGFSAPGADTYTGRVVLRSIGVPSALARELANEGENPERV